MKRSLIGLSGKDLKALMATGSETAILEGKMRDESRVRKGKAPRYGTAAPAPALDGASDATLRSIHNDADLGRRIEFTAQPMRQEPCVVKDKTLPKGYTYLTEFVLGLSWERIAIRHNIAHSSSVAGMAGKFCHAQHGCTPTELRESEALKALAV